MYIVGHYVSTRLSERFSPSVLNGDAAAALYLPDFVRCHEWGYAQCFRLSDADPAIALVKSHMLGDWWVHYGDGEVDKRRGWAYRRMAIYARCYDEFFAAAARDGLLVSPDAPRDSVRGFSHTMMEYAIDTHLAARLSTDTFHSVQRSVARIGTTDDNWSVPAVLAFIASRGIEGSFESVAADMASFRTRAAAASQPAEFAYRAGVKKFGLHETPASLRLVANTIHEGLAEIPGTEIDDVVAATASFIARHVGTRH